MKKIKRPDLQKIKNIKRPNSFTFILYMCRLVFRGIILLAAVYLYFVHRDILVSFVRDDFLRTFDWRHVLWIILMLGMIIHILPAKFITMGSRKSSMYTYTEPTAHYDSDELYRFVQIMNVKAWKVMLIWLCFNAVFAVLYLIGVIGNAEMLLLSFLYFVSDMICILIFCPFQSLIMKNRCCVNCRIFDWGHFMMYTPLLFIKSFFSWSLFFMACIVLIRWEVIYASHPERFWHGSNTTLQCENCKDKICQIKQPLNEMYRHISKNIQDYLK